jgi:Mce-associated membrane protein
MPSLDEASVLTDMDNRSAGEPGSPDDLSLAADEAEAEAAEAEALAAAARARAKAIRLRRAAAAETAAVVEAAEEPETDETEPDETEPDEVAPEEPSSAPQRSSRRVVLTVVAATLIVMTSLGLLGLGGWMMWRHHQTAAEQRQRAEYAAAASQGVVNLMSLDYNHAKQDVQRIIDSTTGDFKKDFDAQADDFVKVAESSKAITVATVNATAVQSMTDNTANVLLAVTTRVSNAASKEQQPRSWRLSVDVARDGGQIKLAKVEFVP